MIVYQAPKKQFVYDAANGIEDIVRDNLLQNLNINIQREGSEYNSWRNSLGNAMYHVMNTDQIPDDAMVAVEYSIPRTKKRIDVIVSGLDDQMQEKVVIIELKQWTDIELTDKDAIVRTPMRGRTTDQVHPSYQAWSYVTLFRNFNETVYTERIDLFACAYLHNLSEEAVIRDQFYAEHLEQAPVFCKGEKEKLQDFIARYVKHGDSKDILYRIENGNVRPSKELADKLASMMQGNQEFILIDNQKLVYEDALSLIKKVGSDQKHVLIVEGGPGTGKSVVAIHLLVEAVAGKRKNAQYVTKNAAPRAVYQSKLSGTMKKSEIAALFQNSGAYVNSQKNEFDALIVDEAHRLNEKSGVFKNLGENQIKEIIHAANVSIFFIDEDQRVTWQDIGATTEIERCAQEQGASIHYGKLESQFRCNGSDGFLAWVDNALQIRDTANTTLEGANYDFKVVDSPNQLKDLIFEKNAEKNKARLVAGYCWDWVSKKDKKLPDITFPEHDFAMQWNLDTDGLLWVISPNSVHQIGCIHTSQGLDLDYVGVIIGPDLIVRNGAVQTHPDQRAKTDKSLNGYKRDLKAGIEGTEKKADAIIKNTYRTLLTRGLKGCYLYCEDVETREYFRQLVG
ncbi:MAG: DNA/RNA helicase domain-containing protein [Patescibacteria group bacterium]